MLGMLRAAKLIGLAVVLGMLYFQPSISPSFSNTGPVAQEPGTYVPDPVTGQPVNPDTGAPVDPSNPDPVGPIDGPVVPTGAPLPDETLTCDQKGNGGNTDIGVTATSIKLASTMVAEGPGKSFLGDSPIGMQAVIDKVNKAGGICGRFLELELVNDGWDSGRGLNAIKTFISKGAFALPVVPSSEGLTSAIMAKVIRNAKIPVIGTDGMLKQQYEDPYVWPVATATVSTMRVIAKHAVSQGAEKLGIVWDRRYRFGVEGRDAFVEFVKNSLKKQVVDVGIEPGKAGYSTEIKTWNDACAGSCDAVVLLLEPGTAQTWIKGSPQMGNVVTSGAQTLFQENFAQNCGSLCSGMLVWTGYNPPIEQFAGLPDVKQYREDVTGISPTVDYTNQFLQGAYLGMTVFVEALKAVGPRLTRERLAQEMNSKNFKNDIAPPLKWTATNRHANCSAQAFKIKVAQGSFAGFGYAQTGFIADPKC